MDVGSVKRQIKLKELQKFYIFTGEEYKVQDIYIDKISEVTNKPKLKIDDVKSLYNRGRSFIQQSYVFVVRDDVNFIKSEKYWDKLNESLKDDILIFLWTSADKRTKFYKYFEDSVVVFNHMNDDVLSKYVYKSVALSPNNLKRFIDICEHDYGRLLIESDKIRTYSNATGKSLDMSFIDLITEGAIYIPPEDAIFKFVDAVLLRNSIKAFSLLEECKKIGEPSLRLIYVLYTNLKKVLQVQSCTSKDIASSTGLSWWDIKCTDGKTNYWRNGELVYMLKLLRQLDKSIKTGLINDVGAVDYFLVNVF